MLGSLIWLYFILIASSAGTLKSVGLNKYDYVDPGISTFTMVLSVITALWMFYFIVDCQHMIIAGSVARWFFTRLVLKNIVTIIGLLIFSILVIRTT